MQIVVCCTAAAKEELENMVAEASIVFISSPQDFLLHQVAEVFIDLLFEKDERRIEILKRLVGLVIINSVPFTLAETHPSFVRINGWEDFIKSPVIEASAGEECKIKTQSLFKLFNKTVEWLPDEPGFVSPRIISMIINEAYFALEEGVSTKEDIDTAMKLGTAYPFGPFEWAEKIGPNNIVALLEQMAREKVHYKPAPMLIAESLTGKI